MKLLLVGILLSWAGGLGGLSCVSHTRHYSALTNKGKSNIILKAKFKEEFLTFERFRDNYINNNDSLYAGNEFVQVQDTAKSFEQVFSIKDENINFDTQSNTVTLIIPPHKKMLLPTPWSFYFKSISIEADACENEMFLKGNNIIDFYFDNIPESYFESANDKIKDVEIGCY